MQRGKMIIRDEMTELEKKVFIKILYNREVILARDFTKIQKVKKKVAPL